MIIEVIVTSVEDAVAAEAGGADRLEIISRFELGGLTPPLELVSQIASRVTIPARVMVREIENFFVDDSKIIERMCDRIRSFSDFPIDGVVLGLLRKSNGGVAIDNCNLARVLSCAPGRPQIKATFHRAFEELADPIAAIEELKSHPRVDRILTSGFGGSWEEKVAGFEAMERAARPRIGIIAGGGLDLEAVGLLSRRTPVREYHLGRSVRSENSIYGAVESRKVAEFARLLKKI